MSEKSPTVRTAARIENAWSPRGECCPGHGIARAIQSMSGNDLDPSGNTGALASVPYTVSDGRIVFRAV
jgi:hypothetical protein